MASSGEGDDTGIDAPPKRGLLPALKSIGKKKQRPREQILYNIFYDSKGQLDRMLTYLNIEKWSERRHWFIMWAEISMYFIIINNIFHFL